MTIRRPTSSAGPTTPADQARMVGRGVRTTARYAARGARAATLRAHRAASAQGAGESGLFRLIELNAFSAAGVTAVGIALAGTLFFQVPTGEARGQVALFLGLTMLPFTVVAPLIGPFLDRFSHGRRWAIGATMAIQAFLAWVLSSQVASQSTWMFAAALGFLVSTKAYAVLRAAAIPRLLPDGQNLVKANGRTSLAGIVGATVAAPVAGGLARIGPEWSLRFGFALFVLATIWAVLLPKVVDSSRGEGRMVMAGEDAPATATRGPQLHIPGPVALALRSNCGTRWMTGFLTMFMAFLLRQEPVGDWRPQVLLGLVIGAAGLGNTLGIALASLLRNLNPQVTIFAALLVDIAAALVATLFYAVLPLALLGLAAGLASSLAKLSLDSIIQTHVPERVQTSAFARSDTTLQLAWVIGGFIGIGLPLIPALGMGLAVGVLAVWTAFVLATRPRPAG